jgi:hypothetical protein
MPGLCYLSQIIWKQGSPIYCNKEKMQDYGRGSNSLKGSFDFSVLILIKTYE